MSFNLEVVFRWVTTKEFIGLLSVLGSIRLKSIVQIPTPVFAYNIIFKKHMEQNQKKKPKTKQNKRVKSISDPIR